MLSSLILDVSEQFGNLAELKVYGAYVTAKVQNHLSVMLFTLILLQQLLPTPQKKEGVIACNFLSCTNKQSATCVRWKVEQSVEAPSQRLLFDTLRL